jgi:hypothetical protein
LALTHQEIPMAIRVEPNGPPDQEHERRSAAVDAAVARGIADAEAGRVKPLGSVFDRLEAEYASGSP